MTAAVPQINQNETKETLVEKFRDHLTEQGFTIHEIDASRPWGAFLRVANSEADKFVDTYFDDLDIPHSARKGERSPKFLLVAPHSRLSWQYHKRRAEYWRALGSTVGVFVSESDAQPDEFVTLSPGDTIDLPGGLRHRLVGLDGWGAVAEIWIHTDPDTISDEGDIVRLQDDYQRN
jgi:mannose-6-phosphate isomerase-like protein (cupin superfamily)